MTETSLQGIQKGHKMFGFSIRTRQNGTGSSPQTGSPGPIGSPTRLGAGTTRRMASPKAEVGEIDTRAPFQSVKAALSIFVEAGAGNSSAQHKRSISTIEERVLEKETQHHLTLKELENLKEQIRSTEVTKAQALRELDNANRTMESLTNKLETLSESKQAAIIATEAAKKRLKELEELKSSKAQIGEDAWKIDVDNERVQYKASTAELISAKQELTNLRQDFDAALEAKLRAFQESVDAQHKIQVNQGKVSEMSKEISTMRETLSEVTGASLQGEEEHLKVMEERDARIQTCKTAKEECDSKSKSLNEEFESGLDEDFEEKIEETNETITVLQEQLNDMRATDLETLRTVSSELEIAKKELHEILLEENSVRSIVESLKEELKNMKKERYEIEKAALAAEAAVENLQIDLENGQKELDAINEGEIKLQDESDDTYINIQKLTSEAEAATKEAEEIKENIVLLTREAETARLVEKETEEKLQIALKTAEEAKVAEKLADDQIHNPSNGAAQTTNSRCSGKIKLSFEEYESLKKKVEQSKSDADIKVATAKAQAESIRTSEKEALKKLEASMKENEDFKTAIENALKQAEMAEAAKQVVEGELRKKREKELNDPAESSHTKEATE